MENGGDAAENAEATADLSDRNSSSRYNFDYYKLRGGENVTFSVKKITGSHTRRNFEDNDLIFFLNSQN